jgi:hypothetical protein
MDPLQDLKNRWILREKATPLVRQWKQAAGDQRPERVIPVKNPRQSRAEVQDPARGGRHFVLRTRKAEYKIMCLTSAVDIVRTVWEEQGRALSGRSLWDKWIVNTWTGINVDDCVWIVDQLRIIDKSLNPGPSTPGRTIADLQTVYYKLILTRLGSGRRQSSLQRYPSYTW